MKKESSAGGASAAMAWVGLGSNLGDSLNLLGAAGRQLASRSAVPLARSGIWRTSPVDCPFGSPDFFNAVVGLLPFDGETPETLLSKLQEIERALGRQPKRVRNESRPLDLDLITFGRETRSGPALTLPHPRAHLRRFVLQPLAEVAPDLVLPGQQRSVAQLLALLPTGECLTRVGSWPVDPS